MANGYGGEEDRQSPRILGRGYGDADRLFPRFTSAAAACTNELQRDGKTLKLWEYAQLETLSANILRQRCMTIRDFVGVDNCPPMPSSQAQDMIRWILHMQGELTDQRVEVGRPKPGRGNTVPAHFLQESQDRPITRQRVESPRHPHAPFGPRTAPTDHVAKRDSYWDLKESAKEFAEAEHHMRKGITTQRPGGEGRRHIQPESKMMYAGVSNVDAVGIATLRDSGEGRRYLGCSDSLGDQLKESEALNRGLLERPGPPAPMAHPEMHVSHTVMETVGVAAPAREPDVGGERRRHYRLEDHMEGQGTSKMANNGHVEDPRKGRRHLDSFSGARYNNSDKHDNYNAAWRKDPSRLHGSSLII
eukprot:TRINITY_DN21659_c0_g1_i1.p1 TRINITY_DN21659_c0_g1~~TRINITY_DN21659_c0_g1_i1.p1  ORF type:complete len:380 (-),score=61.89 TRINITY_DN21659_c0_g1_i1:88-1170(-)